MRTLKRLLLISLFCLSILVFPLVSQALNVQDVPNPRVHDGGWVTDMADVLSAETESQLNSMISELDAENGTEIAVVTVPETQPYATPKEFTTELFNHWGIGKTEANNGILFLISAGDRRVEIETGYGIEAILPDAKVGRILDTSVLPHLKDNDFDTGVLQGTKALIAAVEDEAFSGVFRPKGKLVSLTEQELQILSMILMTIAVFCYFSARLCTQPILLETGEPNLHLRKVSRTKPNPLFHRHNSNQGTQENKYILVQYILYASSWIAVCALSLLIWSYSVWLFFLFVFASIYKFVYQGIRKFQKKQFTQEVKIITILGTIIIFLITFFPLFLIISLVGVIALSISSVGGSIFLAFPISFAFAPILKKKLNQTANFNIIYLDAQTGQPLETIDPKTLNLYLTEAEKVAQQVGNVEYKGFQSPYQKIHIRAFILNRDYGECPQCQEFTLSRNRKVTKRATYQSKGTRLITDTCQCCGYQTATKETIPRREHSSPSRYSDHTSEEENSDDFSGGESFGGGDSGGGGAGGDF